MTPGATVKTEERVSSISHHLEDAPQSFILQIRGSHSPTCQGKYKQAPVIKVLTYMSSIITDNCMSKINYTREHS